MIWVIEIKNGDKWEPCIDAFGNPDAKKTRVEAFRAMRFYKEETFGVKYRVKKYVRDQ